MNKYIDKDIIKTLSGECSQKLRNRTNLSATDTFKTASKSEIQKPAEATGYLIYNEITYKITKVSSILPLNNPKNSKVKQKIKDLIEKHQKKDVCLQNRDNELLIN